MGCLMMESIPHYKKLMKNKKKIKKKLMTVFISQASTREAVYKSVI